MKRALSIQLLASAVLFVACQSGPLQGPPELRLGRDTCAECGMIISEQPFACALLVEHDGSREHALFDDAGCMLDYRHKQEASHRTLGSFVVDYKDRRWLPAESSWYAIIDDHSIRTPMASGIVAFGTKDAAQAALANASGKVVPWSELAGARGDGPQPGSMPQTRP